MALESAPVMVDARAAARFATVATLVAAAAANAAAMPAEQSPAGEVAIFYYPWYGTPQHDGAWAHWNQNGVAPPADVSSAFYPARGAYSSRDDRVVAAQMAEIARAGIETVIVSWWGAGSPEDERLPAVARLAHRKGLEVAVLLEPYPGRSPGSLVREIERLRSLGVTDVYVYDSPAYADSEWAEANATLDGVRVFAHTALPGKALAGGFEGLYTYDVRVFDGRSFPRMCNSARRLGLVCAPSVGPGFDARQATGDGRVQPRRDGMTYDRMWRGAMRAAADVVTITSYNEWHEGTQIEAATPRRAYESYDGAWGLVGAAAEHAYLDRTAYWAGRYRVRIAQYSAVASRRR